MTDKLVQFGVLIGRFQPFHKGHLEVVRDALTKTERLMILVGSSNRPRTFRNPFSFSERAQMIWDAIDSELKLGITISRITVAPLPDRLYDNTGWVEQVQHLINQNAVPFVKPLIGLFGHERDGTSAYLKDFPEWVNLTVPEGLGGNVNATTMRKRYFGFTHEVGMTQEGLPASTSAFLNAHRASEAYEQVREDHISNLNYVTSWGKGPHVTADAVVLRAGRVLLIKRSQRPLKGAWALPGGFLEVHRGETLYQCATRELVEETNIDLHGMSLPKSKHEALTAQMLRDAFRAQYTFDDPNRSERGRIITTAFGFDLGGRHLPPVKAADDAADVWWAPLSEIRSDEMFDDHAFIVQALLRKMAH